MRLDLVLFSVLLKISCSFGQVVQDGSSCDRAILISDTVESVQVPRSIGTTWYKFKSAFPLLSVKIFRAGNYIIYESNSNEFCSTSVKDNIVFAFGDSLKTADNKYVRYKASELNGLCSCNNCLKASLTFNRFKVKNDAYYYIQLINTEQPLELKFNRKALLNKTQSNIDRSIKKHNPCEIVFLKSHTTGMISSSDSLKNKPFNSQEWISLKYALHIYYIQRDLQQRIFKIRDYGLDEIASKCALDSLVKFLLGNPKRKIIVTGYVTKGEDKLAEKYELEASEALAKITRNYLVDHKVLFNQIKIEGKGSSQQLYKDEKSQVSFMYEKNRNNRVEIKLLNAN